MLDYAQRLQLALGDIARRSVLKVVAGVVLAVAVGFLIAALWSWLASGLGWGATLASLAVGGGFALIGIIILLVASKPKHTMPTGDDLRREVGVRVSLATDAAVGRAQSEALRVADMAENKVHSQMDRVGFRSKDTANRAERAVHGFVRKRAEDVGLDSENAADARERVMRASESNAGSMAKLIGAFAIGVTLAAKLQERRRSDEDIDDFL
jgi:hypothetical protein